jgi:aquaporin related protein
MKALEYETANPGADHDGREVYHEHGHGHGGTTRYETAQTSTSRSHTMFFDTYPDLPVARQATDGADERDVATRFQSGTRHLAKTQHQAMPSMTDAATVSTTKDCTGKPATPTPVYMHGMDGHRDTVNHPDDRPRAHHYKHKSSQYEMASDSSYRHGPSAESGSSES